MKVSLELLYHFECDRCSRWWSIADFEWNPKQQVFCPYCCKEHDLPENPLLAEDFKSETHDD